jgi:D-sedoheptulose 7-phosphate isomerase
MTVQAPGSPAAAHLERTLRVLVSLDAAAVERLAEAVLRAHGSGGTIFACGNGGSASTASHFAQDLAKSTLSGTSDRQRLRVISLVDGVSSLTAWANDHGYESVFEQPLRALGRPGDLLVAFSGSGNSANVVAAVRHANANGIETFAVTGFDGGELRRIAQDAVHVPAGEMELAENAHLVVAHQVVCAVREWKRERERGR